LEDGPIWSDELKYSKEEQELRYLFLSIGQDALQRRYNIPKLIASFKGAEQRLKCLILEILTRWRGEVNQTEIELDTIIDVTNGDTMIYHLMTFLMGYKPKNYEETKKILRKILEQAIKRINLKKYEPFQIWRERGRSQAIEFAISPGIPIDSFIRLALHVQLSRITTTNSYINLFEEGKIKEMVQDLIKTIYNSGRFGRNYLFYLSLCLEIIGISGTSLEEFLEDSVFQHVQEDSLYDIISVVGRFAPSIFQQRDLLQLLYDQFITQTSIRPKILEVIGEIGEKNYDLIAPKFDWLLNLTSTDFNPVGSQVPTANTTVKKFYEALVKIGIHPPIKQRIINKLWENFTECGTYPKVLAYIRENYDLFIHLIPEHEFVKRLFGLIKMDFDSHAHPPEEDKIELKNWIKFLAQRQPSIVTNEEVGELYSLKEHGRLDLNLDELFQKYDHKVVNEICELLDLYYIINLTDFYVVPSYIKYDDNERTRLQTFYNTIKQSLEKHNKIHENFLIWGSPGLGKTFLIEKIAESLHESAQFKPIDFSKSTPEGFSSELNSIENELDSKNIICLIDEIDSKSNESWPFEKLRPFLDANLNKDFTLICLLIGSSGTTVQELKSHLSKSHKGNDIISRIPAQNYLDLYSPTTSDKFLLIIELTKKISIESKKLICSIEKFAFLYLSQIPEFGNPRQIKDLLRRVIQRIDNNETKLYYDHFFLAGDSKRYRFWDYFKDKYNRYENQFISF